MSDNESNDISKEGRNGKADTNRAWKDFKKARISYKSVDRRYKSHFLS